MTDKVEWCERCKGHKTIMRITLIRDERGVVVDHVPEGVPCPDCKGTGDALPLNSDQEE